MNEKLGDRELDLMQALWQRGAGTVGDVHQALLEDGHQVAYTTVQTMLNRLEEKGLVNRRKRGRAFVYRALVKQPAAAGEALRRVIDRFFGGDPAELATHLVAGSIGARDLDRLQDLIDARRRGEKKP
jgi:BlaI family transcriptional regulator, penicillinase repressor